MEVNMSVFVCGDTHFPHDAWKLNNRHWPEQKELTKDDYLIIAGDFGLIWGLQPDKAEIYCTRELNNRKFTTLFVDGNHENFDRLDALPEVDMFGGKVGQVSDSIFHLKRGYIYTIDGKKFFCFGGAMSTDKEHRREYISWWPQEVQTKEQEDFALENLDKHNWTVDYVITHAAPRFVVEQMGYRSRIYDPVSRFLEHVYRDLEYKSWHFGHYHTDRSFSGGFYCHYNTEPYKLF